MKPHELYRLIDLQPEIVQRLDALAGEIDLTALSPCLEQLQDIRTAPEAYEHLQKHFQTDEDNLRMLFCQLECACRIYGRYQEMHIDDSIYRDTMKCFSRFLAECRQKNGRMFFDRGWWTYRQISMSLFRIGALEYEFPPAEERGCIAVHIPSDADLSETSVDISLAKADTFFRIKYPDYKYDRYVCDSWLMSPALSSLLPEDSNIISFQRRFSITGACDDDSGCLEWLFRSPRTIDFESLPEDTRLQKKAKALLLSGGHIGAANGTLYIYSRPETIPT